MTYMTTIDELTLDDEVRLMEDEEEETESEQDEDDAETETTDDGDNE